MSCGKISRVYFRFFITKRVFFIPSFSALYSASHREGDLEAIPEPRNSQSVLETINWLFSFRGSPLRPTDPTYLAAFRNPGPPRRPAHSNHTQKPRPGDLHHRYTLHAPRTPSSRPLLAKLSNHTYKNGKQNSSREFIKLQPEKNTMFKPSECLFNQTKNLKRCRD